MTILEKNKALALAEKMKADHEAYLDKLENPPEGMVLVTAKDDDAVKHEKAMSNLYSLLVEKVKQL